MTALPPGSTIGILGGGQLGRMTALAAANLGYRCHIFAPDAESPAALVSADWTRADYDDHAALRALASKIDVATYEFENVPVACAAFLEQLAPVRPGTEPLRVAQHRAREKAFFEGMDVPVAPCAVASNEAELIAAAKHVGLPAIAKTATDGYDGKGQARLEAGTDLPAVWAALGGRELACLLQHLRRQIAGDHLGDVGCKDRGRMTGAGCHVESDPVLLRGDQLDQTGEARAFGVHGRGCVRRRIGPELLLNEGLRRNLRHGAPPSRTRGRRTISLPASPAKGAITL